MLCNVSSMDVVLDIHSWFRWVVLVALLAVGVLGLVRSVGGTAWDEGSDRPFTLATIMLDMQLALGIILWTGNSEIKAGSRITV